MKILNEDKLAGVGEDEPVFVLRASDPLSGRTVRYHAQATRDFQPDNTLAIELNEHAEKMDAWRRANPS